MISRYFVRLVQSVCLIGLLYWGINYELNYVFWIGSGMFILMGIIFAIVDNLILKQEKRKQLTNSEGKE